MDKYGIGYKSQPVKFLSELDNNTKEIIIRKIEWLTKNIHNVIHRRLKTTKLFSLHSGQYRIIYGIDSKNKTITIEIIDKHDDAYHKLRKYDV